MSVHASHRRSDHGACAHHARESETAREVAGGWAVRLLSGLIHVYRYLISPWLGPRCRYLPTCSDYALEALATRGVVTGCWLALRRVARCHPLGGSGYDPVPPRRVDLPRRAPIWR
jgi:putative membrane protein insertion efficiency factor